MGTFIPALVPVNNGVTIGDGTGDTLPTGANIIKGNNTVLATAINQLASSLGSSLKPFATKADLIAAQPSIDVSHGSVVCVVWNDATQANNIPYVWDGTTLNPSFDRPTYLMLAALGNALGFQQPGAGSVLRTFQDKSRDIFNVFDLFTDTQKADALTGAPTYSAGATIQNAINNAAAMGQRIEAFGTFRIDAADCPIVFKGNADFSQATFLVYGAPAIALEISTGNASDPTTNLFNATVKLPKRTQNMTKPGTGWAGQGIGVRTVNTYSCNIYTGNIYGFALGALLTSFGTGNVYNEYHLGHFENNQINLNLLPGNSTGWVNENNFYGGRFSHVTGEGTNVAGTRHIVISESANKVNNNLFIKPSIEGNVVEYNLECAGAYNTFQQARWESTTPTVWWRGSSITYGTKNVIAYGYNAESIVQTVDSTCGNLNQILVVGGTNKVNSGPGINGVYQVANGSSDNYPIHSGYPGGNVNLPWTTSNWCYQLGANTFNGKRYTDAASRVVIDFRNGRMYFGDGTAAPTMYCGNIGSSSLGVNATFLPATTTTFDLGSTSLRWSNNYSVNFRPGAGTAMWTSGAGTPEGVVTAVRGSMFTRTDGGAGTTLYIKESGTGNTGWVAK